jgi:hypothetical protein
MRGFPTTATPHAGRLLDAAEIAVASAIGFPDHPFRDWPLYGKAKCLEAVRTMPTLEKLIFFSGVRRSGAMVHR